VINGGHIHTIWYRRYCININENTKQSKKYIQQREDITDNVIDFSANFTDMRSRITHILYEGGRH